MEKQPKIESKENRQETEKVVSEIASSMDELKRLSRSTEINKSRAMPKFEKAFSKITEWLAVAATAGVFTMSEIMVNKKMEEAMDKIHDGQYDLAIIIASAVLMPVVWELGGKRLSKKFENKLTDDTLDLFLGKDDKELLEKYEESKESENRE